MPSVTLMAPQSMLRRLVLACLLGEAGGLLLAEAHAESATQAPIKIEAQSLNSALRSFSPQTGLQLIHL